MSKEGKVVNLINSYLGKEDKFKGIQKAKPKVLKPGSPEHTKAMAEVEATKAAKPKSTNPAGEESPSRPGSRDKLGERPLVEGIDKQVLQTAAERAGAGLRGGQSAPAPTTPAPTPTTPAPKPAAPAPATPTTGASDGMTVAQRNRGVYGRQIDAKYDAQPKSEFKPDARLRNMPTGAGGKGYGTRYGGSGDEPVKPKAPFVDKWAHSEPQHGPGSKPRGIRTRIRDAAQNAMYATGIKNPARQPVEERARVGRKARVIVGTREGSAKNRDMKNVRQAGQVNSHGSIDYPRDTGQYLKSLDESLEKKGMQKQQAHDILADGKPRHWARMGKVPGTEASPVLNTEEKKKVGEAFQNWPGNPKMPNNKGGDPGTRVAGITDHLDKSMDSEEGSRSWSYQG